MRISDWSSYVCSSDHAAADAAVAAAAREHHIAAVAHVKPAANAKDAKVMGTVRFAPAEHGKTGRASCWERVCPYLSFQAVAVLINNKTHLHTTTTSNKQSNHQPTQK